MRDTKSYKWDAFRPKGGLEVQEILAVQKKIVPELVDVLEKRYNILRTIYFNQPIGRRVLASELSLGERIVRTEINFLKEQNLIEINTPGMSVTEEGIRVVEQLKDFMHEIKGLNDVEKFIINGIQSAFISDSEKAKLKTELIDNIEKTAKNYILK